MAMALSYGTQIAFMSNLDQLLNTLNYDDPGKITSYTLLFAMLVGILANPIFSIWLKKTAKYKLITTVSKIDII